MEQETSVRWLGCAGSQQGRSSLRTALLIVAILLGIFAYTQLHDQFTLERTVIHSIDKANITWQQDRGRSNIHHLQEANCTFIDTASVAVSQVQSRLQRYWDISNYPNFKTMMNIPEESWNIQKAKFVKLVLEAGSNRAVSQIVGEAPQLKLDFVAGFSGSSVTAGHDNYFDESFPQVFERTLTPVFAALGVPFVVRNHALGNNPCYPYDACVATHLGEDLDLLVWEQSMNCGRWSTPLDTFARASYHMPKKPTLLFLTSGGPTWTRQDCLNRNLTALSSPRGALTAAERAISAHSLRQNAVVNPFLEQFTFLKDPGGALLARRFASLAPMAQSLFGCDEYKCLGPYTADFCEKTPGGGAAHHPGRLMHQLRGENLAYFYLSILQEALDDVRTLLDCAREVPVATIAGVNSAGAGDRVSAVPNSVPATQPASGRATIRSRRLQHSHHTPSSPASSTTTETSLTTAATTSYISAALHLTTLEAPPWPGAGAAKATANDVYAVVLAYLRQTQNVDLPPVPSAYNIAELSNERPQCHTDFEPRMQNALADIIIGPYSNWKAGLSFLDAAAVEKSILKGHGYIDRKYIYTSTGVNSTLAVTVQVSSASATSAVWLCEVQKGFAKYPSTAADLSDGADVYVDLHQGTTAGREVNAGRNASYLPPNLAAMKHIELQPFYIQCYRTSPLPSGTHTLVLVQKTDKMINLAYVVSW